MSTLGSQTGYRYAYEFDVAGSHLKARQEALEVVKPGLEIYLEREPENPHDENAVAIYALGAQIGYVPSSRARMVAEYLDRGKPVYARIVDTHWRDDTTDDLMAARIFLGFDPPPIDEQAVAAETPPQKSGAEKMVAAGEAMQKAGSNMTSCGCSIMALLIIAAVLFLVFKAC
jgi:hypothetical protein